MEARLRPTICATSFNLSNRFMRTPLADYRVEVPALASPSMRWNSAHFEDQPGPTSWYPAKRISPCVGSGPTFADLLGGEALSSLPLPLPETRAQVAARFASACLVVPLGILSPPGRSQPLPSPSPLAAFAAVRSIGRLPLLGGEARRRSRPRPGRRCAASCWIVVSSIAPCRRLIPLGRSFLAGFINEVLAKGNVVGNSSLRQWKATPYPAG